MTHSLNKLIGGLSGAILLGFAGTAAASEPLAALGAGYSSMDAPLGAPTELQVELRGQVAARCDLTAPPALGGHLNFGRSGRVQSAFAIDCNTPFVMRVRSRHGAFVSAEPAPGAAARTPYEIHVEVGTDAGRQNLGWCESASLGDEGAGSCAYASRAVGGGWSAGDATAIEQSGSIQMRWDEPEADAPRLGSYSDVIIIELEVRA